MMVNVSNFVRNHVSLCICTLGLIVLGYLGYRTVHWIINKCHRIEKIDEVAQNIISTSNSQPSAISEKEALKAELRKFPIMNILWGREKLAPTQSLTNAEICCYTNLIAIKHPELYPWEHSFLSARLLLQEDLPNKFLVSNCRYLFTIVLVDGSHWTLLLVDKELKTVEYYDSKHNCRGEDYETTIKEAKEVAGFFNYKFEEKISESIQSDGYQCGIWVLYFLEERIKNPNVSFNALSNPSELIANYRKHVSDKFSMIRQIFYERTP